MATQRKINYSRAIVRDRSFFLGGRDGDGNPACKATFTIEVEAGYVARNGCKPHYTFRVEYCPANGIWPESWMVKMLQGEDFRYVGMLEGPKVRLTRKSHLNHKSHPYRILCRVIFCYWAGQQDKITAAGWRVLHEGRCCVCGRPLTNPESVDRGIGPECFARQ